MHIYQIYEHDKHTPCLGGQKRKTQLFIVQIVVITMPLLYGVYIFNKKRRGEGMRGENKKKELAKLLPIVYRNCRKTTKYSD